MQMLIGHHFYTNTCKLCLFTPIHVQENRLVESKSLLFNSYYSWVFSTIVFKRVSTSGKRMLFNLIMEALDCIKSF